VDSPGSPSPLIVLSSRLLWSLPVAEAAEAAATLGFQGLEIWTEHLWREGSPSELKEQLARLPLRYFLHAPFMDLNLCSRNARVAQLSLAEQLRALELARDLKIRLVVVHPGRCSSSKDSPEEYWPPLLEALGRSKARRRSWGSPWPSRTWSPVPRNLWSDQLTSRAFWRNYPAWGCAWTWLTPRRQGTESQTSSSSSWADTSATST